MKRKSKHFLELLSFLGIIIAVCITTIGYSLFNSNLNISGDAIVKVDDIISIVDLNVSSLESGAYEQYNSSYNNKVIDYHIVLPNADSYIIYKADIKNKTNRDYGIVELSGLPDNLTYEFIDYNIGDKLCTSNTCNNGAIDEVYFKIKYNTNGYDSNNTTYSGRLKFEFDHFYSVLYINVSGSSLLKQSALRRSTFIETIPIPTDYKLIIRMNGVLLVRDINYTYNETTSLLTIPNVSGSIVITLEEPSTEFTLAGTGNGNPFSYRDTEYDINNKTFFLEADFTNVNLSTPLDNIISIGSDVDEWGFTGSTTGVNLHVYYPSLANTTSVQVDLTHRYLNTTSGSYTSSNSKFTKSLDLSRSNLFRMAFNKNGLYINGTKMFDSSGKGTNVSVTPGDPTNFLSIFFDLWENENFNIDIGSTEGSNRSHATYNNIKIYNSLFTVEELIDKTTIRVEETPVEEEINYADVSEVLIGSSTTPTLITYPFEPNNNSFMFTSPEFIDLNLQSLYLEMDVSNLKQDALLENLISVGNNFVPTAWTGSGIYNFHIFYPDTVSTDNMIVALLNGTSYSQFTVPVSLIDNKYIKLMLSKNGIYMNGEKIFSSDGSIKSGIQAFGNNGGASTIVSGFFDRFTFPLDNSIDFKYGSAQGTNRSSAQYDKIRLYGSTLTEEQIIGLTS